MKLILFFSALGLLGSAMCDVRWERHSHGAICADAVKVGRDKDGGTLYVGRALHGSDLIPGKVSPNHKMAYIAYQGREHPIRTYEVLCSKEAFTWQELKQGRMPHGALEGGQMTSGEHLYVCRVVHEGTSTPGKLLPSTGKCYIAFGGKEHGYTKYDILTAPRNIIQ